MDDVNSVLPQDFDFGSPDEEEGETFIDAAEETEEASATPSVLNWDADDNPYKAKVAELETNFKGLQGTVQQQVERARALELQLQQEAQQRQAYEDHLLRMRLASSGLSPQEQNDEFFRHQETRRLATENQYYRQQMTQMHMMQEQVAAQQAAQILAERHGITEWSDLLLAARTPAEMEAMAGRIAERQGKQQRGVRQETKADSFGNRQPSPTPRKQPQTFAEAGEALSELWKKRFSG